MNKRTVSSHSIRRGSYLSLDDVRVRGFVNGLKVATSLADP